MPDTITQEPAISTGLHRNIDFTDYQQIKLPNSSAVKWGLKSMKHMRACIDGILEDNDTKDRKFGRAMHCILLEPDALEERFPVALPCGESLKSGDRKGMRCGGTSKAMTTDGMWVCGIHSKGKMLADLNGQEFVSPEEDKRLHDARDMLRGHLINKILHRAGWSEISAVWDHGDGMLMKGRLDRLADDHSLILDIKKCQVGAGTREEIEASIANYGWHRQAAMYVDGVAANTGETPMFAWVVVEDGPPYDVNFLPADDETLAIGRAEVNQVMLNWRHALSSGEYPGYIKDASRVPRGGLAEWYRRKYNSKVI